MSKAYCCGTFKDMRENGYILKSDKLYFIPFYSEGGFGERAGYFKHVYSEGGFGERAGYFKHEIRFCPFCGEKLGDFI